MNNPGSDLILESRGMLELDSRSDPDKEVRILWDPSDPHPELLYVEIIPVDLKNNSPLGFEVATKNRQEALVHPFPFAQKAGLQEYYPRYNRAA